VRTTSAQGGKKMNKLKSTGVIRLIAFFLVAVVLVCSFGFTADGWHISGNAQQNKNENINSSTGNNSVQNGQNSETPTPPNDYIPSYINPLTGLEITKEQSSLRPIGFVLDGLSPLYSISLCDVVVELPIENGGTRIFAITSDMTNAWKIGSLAHTRGYISNIGKFFDAIIASTGNDDSIDYISCDTAKEQLLLSVDNTYCYSEYSYYLYTNVNLINSSLNAYQINQNRNDEKTSPFNFVSFLTQAGLVAIGELVVCFTLGLLLVKTIKNKKIEKYLNNI
jgi:hypothetical protein